MRGLFQLQPVMIAADLFTPLAVGSQATLQRVATIPDPQLRPRAALKIGRLYLPLFCVAVNSDSTRPCHAAYMTVTASVAGAILWLWQTDLPLTPWGSPTAYSVANTIAADDLVNPLELDVHETIDLGITIGFDQSVTGWEAGLGYTMTQPGTFTPSPGSASYSTD